MQEQVRPAISRQDVAYIFASRMREAKRNKRAITDEAREALAQKDLAYLEAKKDNFSFTDRAVLVFKAKSKHLSKLSKDERRAMHREAGYTDDQIDKITGKKLLLSAAVSQGLWAISLAGRGVGTINEKIVPLIDNIPPTYTTAAVIGSMAAYTASYAWFIEKNLDLTKNTGTSANPSVTGLYFLSDKLFPDKIRDHISRGVPIAQETVMYNVIYPLAIQGATGEPGKIIAGSLAATALNLIFTAGCGIWDKAQNKKK